MVIYDLACHQEHRFEAWFRSPGDYEHQFAHGLLACPLCGSPSVHKLPTASRINRGCKSVEETADSRPSQHPGQLRAVLNTFRGLVERNFEYVGERFAEEARRIHYGETDARNIRGISSPAQALALAEEGIQVIPLPALPPNPGKLN